MNLTNADKFKFSNSNSALLVGQTGSGKSYLVHQLVKRYESAYKPDEMKYAFFDLKQCEFTPGYEDGAKQEYLLFDVELARAPNYGFNRLDELVTLSMERAKNNIKKPFIFTYIEECDMSCRDQNRFDNALIIINQNAKKANMKLIYSTSSPRVDTVSMRLLDSFDEILAGIMPDGHYEYLGITPQPLSRFEFMEINRANTKDGSRKI